MKQKITKEQFEEISKKEQKTLMAWANEKQYYIFGTGYRWNEATGKSDYVGLPPFLIDIGQMVEFLDEHNGSTWGALIYGYDDFFKPVDQWCDALWGAVKQILKNEPKRIN